MEKQRRLVVALAALVLVVALPTGVAAAQLTVEFMQHLGCAAGVASNLNSTCHVKGWVRAGGSNYGLQEKTLTVDQHWTTILTHTSCDKYQFWAECTFQVSEGGANRTQSRTVEASCSDDGGEVIMSLKCWDLANDPNLQLSYYNNP